MSGQQDISAYAPWLRRTTPYIHSHRGKIFVIYLDDDTILSPQFTAICQDIELLHSLGIKLILCFGVRSQIDRELRSRRIESNFVNGLRISDKPSIPIIEQVIGQTRIHVEAKLSQGLPNSPLDSARISVVSGNLITARPIGIHHGVDYMHTGAVRRIDTLGVKSLLDSNSIVLLPPLGVSSTGDVFNLSSYEVALTAATTLKADKLIFLSSGNNLSDTKQETIHELTAEQGVELLSQAQHLPEKTLTLLEKAVSACKKGVPRSHILDSNLDGALLAELFTLDGTGTLVTRDEYENLRSATLDDVPGIMDITCPLENSGVLVPREQNHIELEISSYKLIERDGTIIACAGLFDFPHEKTGALEIWGEIGCFAVKSEYQGQGRGKRLLKELEKLALTNELEKLFVTTTQTEHWFLESGYQAIDFKELPEQKRLTYDRSRNPKFLVKTLA